MKNKTLLLFGFLLVSLSICAQSSFSYKRQLNYKQCEKCNCKKSRSYKIISTNLTSTQLVCAQEDNRANLTVKEMFQNGTSGGLFGGFNPPQEGCGNDCYHEFVNASDEVETVKIDECLTESQRQKIRDEQERVKNEEIRLDQEKNRIAKNEAKRINELISKQKAKVYTDYYTKDWKDLKSKNVELYIKIQEIIINEWYRLDSLNIALNHDNDCWGQCCYDKKNTLTCYPEYYTDVAELLRILIEQKEIEKASDVLDKFLNYNFPSNNGDGLNMTSFKLLCEKSNKPESNYYGSQGYNKIIGIHRTIKFWILSIVMIEQSKLTMKIMQEFIVPYRPNRDKKFSLVKSIIDDLEERLGYSIADAPYLKFTSKALTSIWDFKISPHGKSKSWLQTYTSYFNKYLEDELYDKNKNITELIIKIEDNLYKSKIDSYNIYYYLDKNGTAFLVTKSAASISTDNEAKLILKAKQIRDKDLLNTK